MAGVETVMEEAMLKEEEVVADACVVEGIITPQLLTLSHATLDP